MTILEASGVHFSYGKREILHDVSLSVAASDSLGIVGESGAGKSTLLALLLGLATPSAGEVRFDGAPLRLCDQTHHLVDEIINTRRDLADERGVPGFPVQTAHGSEPSQLVEVVADCSEIAARGGNGFDLG